MLPKKQAYKSHATVLLRVHKNNIIVDSGVLCYTVHMYYSMPSMEERLHRRLIGEESPCYSACAQFQTSARDHHRVHC
jgi:hypothetical protein